MYDYVLIIHPVNEELLYKYEPGMKHKPRPLVKKLLEWMDPFKAAEIEGLNSHMGRTAKGALVMCPLLLDQMMSLSPQKVMKAVVSAVQYAISLNPKLIGLTAYTAFSGNYGLDFAKLTKLPLTNGANCTLGTIPESILSAAQLMNLNLAEENALIIGGTSNIAKYCIETLSHFTRAMFVNAHNKEKLQLFLSGLPKEKKEKIHVTNDINSVIKKTKLIIVATNRISTRNFDLKKVTPGSIIFDSSYPRRVPLGVRDDVLIIDGQAMKPPGDVAFNFDFGLPEGLCYPCMAEAMTLALERKFESYSLGKEDADPSKVREIVRLSSKHGFSSGGLTSQGRLITDQEVRAIRDNASKKKKKGLRFWLY